MSSHPSPEVATAHEMTVFECRRFEAEIAAFERFGDRIRNLPVDDRTTDGGTIIHPPPRTLTNSVNRAPFHVIRRAYKETVLAVDHWQAAYGEATVGESLAAEFSPALAHALIRPGLARFSPGLRTHLIEASEHARALRERTLSHLEAEAAELDRLWGALEHVTTLLEAIPTGEESFDAQVETVRQTRHILDGLLETHQTYIHGRHPRRYETLVESVYTGLDVTYPGLAAIAAAVAQLEAVELRLWTQPDTEWAAGDNERDRGDRRRLPDECSLESQS